MAVPAADVAGVVQAATANAGAIERANEQTSAADPEARESSGFDVWTQTAAGMGDRVQEDPEASDRALAKGVSGEWARTDSGGVGDSLGQQASDALKEFQLLTGQREPEEGEAASGGVLGAVGATFGILTSLEQMISAPLAVLPFPAFPAIRVTDMDVGLPHGHAHPPNTPPPPPSPPIMLPSTGPIIPIPFLSGATQTLINGMPAARCGDMGLGVWCGGYFPMYEVFLGSSSVWIEGARAGRLLVDITRHCMFSAPRPQDPPLGPMVGMTITSSPNVLIGGVPMPSLLDMAMGAAIQGLFKGIGKAVKKAKAARAARAARRAELVDYMKKPSWLKTPAWARRLWDRLRGARRPGDLSDEYWNRLFDAKFIEGGGSARAKKVWDTLSEAQARVDELLAKKKIVIQGEDELVEMVKEDLVQMAANPVGRETLERMAKSRHGALILPRRGAVGQCTAAQHKWATFDAKAGKPEGGSSSWVRYDPTSNEPGWPPDATLNHELAHAANNAEGVNRGTRYDQPVKENGKWQPGKVSPDPEPPEAGSGMSREERVAEAEARYTNLEEQNVIQNQDNPYREGYNLPKRWGHGQRLLTNE